MHIMARVEEVEITTVGGLQCPSGQGSRLIFPMPDQRMDAVL